MKILALNGSPKRKESDTMHITRAFLDGMNEAAPQEITTLHVIDQHIEYCTGCFACKRNGGTCIHDTWRRTPVTLVMGGAAFPPSFVIECQLS